MLVATIIIAALLIWIAFHALADTLDYIDQQTAQAQGLTSTDGGGEPLSQMARGGEAGAGAERLGSLARTQVTRPSSHSMERGAK